MRSIAARASALRSALWAVALAVSLAAAGAMPARAQPQASDPPQAGSGPREPPQEQEPAPRTASEQTADDEAPEIFVPSEEISGDTVVSFPVDI